MDKKAFRYLYILLIFLIVININIISAGEIDQDTGVASQLVLSDDAGIEEVPDGGDSNTNNVESDENTDVLLLDWSSYTCANAVSSLSTS